jgi:hypothetical protein
MLDPKRLYAKLKTRNVPMLVLVMALMLAAGAMLLSLALYLLGTHTAGSGADYFAMSRELQNKAVTLIILGGLGAGVMWLVVRRTQQNGR